MQRHFPRKDHRKAKFFTKQKLLSLQQQTERLKKCFSFKEKNKPPKWHPEDKWAEQTPDSMQYFTKLQNHCLSKMVTAVIVLTHLNDHISHYCGDYSTSINHKSFIFLAGLLAKELRQDIMPCMAIFHCSCHYVLMTMLRLLLQHQHWTCPSSPANEELALATSVLQLSPEALGVLCYTLPSWTCRARAWLSHRQWKVPGTAHYGSNLSFCHKCAGVALVSLHHLLAMRIFPAM